MRLIRATEAAHGPRLSLRSAGVTDENRVDSITTERHSMTTPTGAAGPTLPAGAAERSTAIGIALVLSSAIADGRMSMVRIVRVPVPVGENDTTWLEATVDSTAVPSSIIGVGPRK